MWKYEVVRKTVVFIIVFLVVTVLGVAIIAPASILGGIFSAGFIASRIK